MNKVIKLVQKIDNELEQALTSYHKSEDSVARPMAVGALIGGIFIGIVLAVQHVFDGIITF